MRGGGFVAGRLYLFGIIPAHGEQVSSGISRPSASGSSPRVRGTFQTISLWILSEGIIPARAGSRLTSSQTPRSGRDHPRACGEQPHTVPTIATVSGSSPRVRGAVSPACTAGSWAGIIPNCAGSRERPSALPKSGWDHPRACGEQLAMLLPRLCMAESSPRVRGAGGVRVRSVVDIGIIPARAGSSMVARRVTPGL